MFYFWATYTSFAITTVTGCATGSETNSQCTSGSEISCTCSNGQPGLQQCLNGIYSTCLCTTADSGTGGAAAGVSEIAGSSGSASASTGGTESNKAITSGSGGAKSIGAAGQLPDLGSVTAVTVPTCPSPFTCVENAWVSAFAVNSKFCGDQSKSDILKGILPPSCTSNEDCIKVGLSEAKCQDLNFETGCLLLCTR